jgi:hypothetical protein
VAPGVSGPRSRRPTRRLRRGEVRRRGTRRRLARLLRRARRPARPMRAPGSAPVARLGCTTRSRPLRTDLAASSAKKRAWPAAVVVCPDVDHTCRQSASPRLALQLGSAIATRRGHQARSCDERSFVAMPATNARPSQPRGCACRPRATRREARGLADGRERDQVARERGEIDARSAVALRNRDRASRLEVEVFCGRERRGGAETPREGLRQPCLAEAWRVSGYRRSAPDVRIGVIGNSVQGVNVGRSRGE